jgi:hypothetical protein
MKIHFNKNLNYLSNGDHEVVISEVTEGISKNSVPFFLCKFENEEGIINYKIYKTENSLPFIKKLFEAVGLYQQEVDTNNLIGKYLGITIKTKDWIDSTTGEIISKNQDVVLFKNLKPF